jgi:hypothetical protein
MISPPARPAFILNLKRSRIRRPPLSSADPPKPAAPNLPPPLRPSRFCPAGEVKDAVEDLPPRRPSSEPGQARWSLVPSPPSPRDCAISLLLCYSAVSVIIRGLPARVCGSELVADQVFRGLLSSWDENLGCALSNLRSAEHARARMNVLSVCLWGEADN